MVHDRWYPTVLDPGRPSIGDSHEVLVVCGHGAGDMEIYDEATDSFREVTSGDNKPFPSLYPGLHLLPNSRVFYSRTGWASAGPGAARSWATTSPPTSCSPGPARAPGPTSHRSGRPCQTAPKACRSCCSSEHRRRRCGSWCWVARTPRTTTPTRSSTRPPCPQRATGVRRRRFRMASTEASVAPCCSPTGRCSSAAAYSGRTRRALCSTRRPTRGRRWRPCRRSATTTRSRCCCRAGRSRWPDGTTPRSRSSTRRTSTAEHGR